MFWDSKIRTLKIIKNIADFYFNIKEKFHLSKLNADYEDVAKFWTRLYLFISFPVILSVILESD